MNKKILLIRTGGTIDARPYIDPYTPPKIVRPLGPKNSLVFPTIRKNGQNRNVKTFVWAKNEEKRFVKDSQLFTPKEIRYVAEIIRQDHDHNVFVITHGTDAMTGNAMRLRRLLGGNKKTVIFVGAMVPLSMSKGGAFGDAVEALEFTFKTLKKGIPNGVYVVGKDNSTQKWTLFDPGSVEKDRKLSKENLAFNMRPNNGR